MAWLVGLSLSLSGCSAGRDWPNVIYIAVGTNKDQTIDSDLLREYNERLQLLEDGYRQINKNSRFQFSFYPEEQMESAIRRRTQAGLGPDLIFVNGDIALQLMERGLITPYPAKAEQLRVFNPEEIERLRSAKGQLAGLPVLQQTQLACFNRQHLPKPPQTMAELLASSASGHPSGLSVDIYNLFWTAGSLGAIPAINQALKGETLSSADLPQIESWLLWLQNASNQQGVTFFASQQALEAEFIAGQLDWIPCRSTSLPRLRRSMEAALGVSNLPDGTAGVASPVNRLRVLALGTSSSVAGRQRALDFASFSVNPLVQRSITVGSQTVLPANRFVKVPVQSSAVLQAMVTAGQQGSQINHMIAVLHTNDPRINSSEQLITRLVFGEITPAEATRLLIAILRNNNSSHSSPGATP